MQRFKALEQAHQWLPEIELPPPPPAEERGIIALDLDETAVFTKQAFVPYSNRHWPERQLRPNDVGRDWPGMWGVDEKEAERRSLQWHTSEEYRSTIALAPGLLKNLGLLSIYYDIVAITDRRQVTRYLTYYMLRNQMPNLITAADFTLVFEDGKNRHDKTKRPFHWEYQEEAKRRGANLVVAEDNVDQANAGISVGATTILFEHEESDPGAYDRLHSDVHIVNHWDYAARIAIEAVPIR